MSIRKRILLFIGVSLVVLTGVISFITNTLVSNAFHELENDVIRRGHARLIAALKSIDDDLARLSGDWAFWDEAYTYAQGINPEFVDVNFDDAAIAALNIQLIFIYGHDRDLKFAAGFDESRDEKIPLSDDVARSVASYDQLFSGLNADDSAGGYVNIDNQLFMIRARPILMSNRQGPSSGVLIFGRNVSSVVGPQIGEIMQHHVSILPSGSPADTHRDQGEVLSDLDLDGMVHQSDDVNYVHTPLLNPRGEVVATVCAEMPRDIHARLTRTQWMIALSIMLAAAVLGFGVLVLLERNLLKPMSALIRGVFSLRADDPRPVTLAGTGETRELGVAINQLISSVRESQQQRQEALKHLAAEKENLAITLASIGDGVITTDENKNVVMLNPVAEWFTGWRQQDAAGRSLDIVFPLLDDGTGRPISNLTADAAARGEPVSRAHDVLLAGNDSRNYLITDSCAPIRDNTGRVSGYVVVFRDMAQIRQADRQEITEEKLKAVGVLAGGIAHDFNNLLTTVSHSIALARKPETSREKAADYLLTAEQSVLRARSLTKQLLTFASGGDPVREPTDVHALIRHAAELASRAHPQRLIYDFDADLMAGDVDAGQLEQCLHNIIINAMEAMPDGGDVRIRTSNVQSGDADRPASSPDERFIRIEFMDEGVGIPAENMNRIFEPYFSTKQRSSGLGLASAMSIVTKHGGNILVKSRVGEGTTMTVVLPATFNKPEAPEIDVTMVPPASGKGRILFMDDEEMLLVLSQEILASAGFDVDVAADGAKAVQLYQDAMASGRPFNLVILDLVIRGGMGGLETIRQIKQIDPDVVAIVSSGYSNDPVMANYDAYGFRDVLPKPYSSVALIDVASKLLNDGSASPSATL